MDGWTGGWIDRRMDRDDGWRDRKMDRWVVGE